MLTDKHLQTAFLDALRCDVQRVFGQHLSTSKDFEALSHSVFLKTRQMVSATTLKRVWGYLAEPVSPRVATLSILAQYVGCRDWDDYIDQHPVAGLSATEPSSPETPAVATGMASPEKPLSADNSFNKNQQSADNEIVAIPPPKSWWRGRYLYLLLVIVLFLVSLTVVFFLARATSSQSSPLVINLGDRFSSPEQYLRIFGIKPKGRTWGKELPHHHSITIWGPAYHHPNWHNEGDADELLPTITEYWTSGDTTPAGLRVQRQRNIDQYYNFRRFDELRITFMKNLVDTGYVFLGVYRIDREHSDTLHLVWERVAERIDLDNLNYLEELHNGTDTE